MDDNYRNIDQTLLTAYVNTVYRVDALDISIRINTQNSKLDQFLIQQASNTWTFVSAWNPRSMPFSQKENDSFHQKLVKKVENYDFKYFSGYGIGIDTSWPPEKSLFILGISKAKAIELGRAFEQNAIVYGAYNQLAQLVIC